MFKLKCTSRNHSFGIKLNKMFSKYLPFFSTPHSYTRTVILTKGPRCFHTKCNNNNNLYRGSDSHTRSLARYDSAEIGVFSCIKHFRNRHGRRCANQSQ